MCAIPCTSDHDMNTSIHITHTPIYTSIVYSITMNIFTLTHMYKTCTIYAECAMSKFYLTLNNNIQVKVPNKLSIKYLISKHTRRIMNFKAEKPKTEH